jgi:CheY-like chemotaxis protein
MATSPLTVLVIENDVEFRVALVDFLHDKGFRVWEACSAAEALARLRAPGELPHLMLVELGLTGIGARALIEAIRQSPARDVPMVALTGYDPAEAEDRLQVPAVAKWQTDRLLALVAKADDRHRGRSEAFATVSSPRRSRLPH